MAFIDLHQDLAGASALPELAAQTSREQLQQADARVVIATGFTLPGEKLEEIVSRDIGIYTQWSAEDSSWAMVRSADDVRTLLAKPGNTGVLFHIEGLPGFKGDLQIIDRWHELGLRSIGLVWNDDNLLGGGTNSLTGLSDAGRGLITYCEEKRILIDLAHANPTMFQDCLTTVTRAPFISHGGLYSLIANKRNYTDDQARAIVERGGIFGIYLAKSSMARGESFTCEDIAHHIKTAVDLLGEGGVAIGTDFGGITSGVPDRLSAVSEIDNLWRALHKAGLSDTQVDKIALRNAQRYLEESLP